MKNNLLKLFFPYLFLALTSCSGVNPEVLPILGSETPLTNTTTKTVINWNQVSLDGNCNPSITDIELSFDNGLNWQYIKTLNPTASISCKTQNKWSALIQITTALYPNLSTVDSSNPLKLQIRGVYNSGFRTNASIINLIYTATRAKPGHRIVDTGFIEMTSGTYKVRGHMIHTPTQTLTGTGYQIRGVIR